MPMLLTLKRRACGFQNLVGTTVYGGHNLPPLIGIGLRWLPKIGVVTSPDPHVPTGTTALGRVIPKISENMLTYFMGSLLEHSRMGVSLHWRLIFPRSFRSKFKVKK